MTTPDHWRQFEHIVESFPEEARRHVWAVTELVLRSFAADVSLEYVEAE
jgi:hypothetical protein